MDVRAIAGSALLIHNALEAVRQWTWAPTLVNGKPVEVVTDVEVTFDGVAAQRSSAMREAFADPPSLSGLAGTVRRIAGVDRKPRLIYKVDPQYSDKARKKHRQGTVVLSLIVDEHGLPYDIRVLRSLGLGLDEKAMEAVAQWRFQPGIKDGHPVKVWVTIEVNFRLLENSRP